MSKRLQVLLSDQEMDEIQQLALNEHLTLGEWVRRTLREAREQKPAQGAETKLQAIRRATSFGFPTGEIGDMLAEIERGYQS